MGSKLTPGKVIRRDASQYKNIGKDQFGKDQYIKKDESDYSGGSKLQPLSQGGGFVEIKGGTPEKPETGDVLIVKPQIIKKTAEGGIVTIPARTYKTKYALQYTTQPVPSENMGYTTIKSYNVGDASKPAVKTKTASPLNMNRLGQTITLQSERTLEQPSQSQTNVIRTTRSYNVGDQSKPVQKSTSSVALVPAQPTQRVVRDVRIQRQLSGEEIKSSASIQQARAPSAKAIIETRYAGLRENPNLLNTYRTDTEFKTIRDVTLAVLGGGAAKTVITTTRLAVPALKIGSKVLTNAKVLTGAEILSGAALPAAGTLGYSLSTEGRRGTKSGGETVFREAEATRIDSIKSPVIRFTTGLPVIGEYMGFKAYKASIDKQLGSGSYTPQQAADIRTYAQGKKTVLAAGELGGAFLYSRGGERLSQMLLQRKNQKLAKAGYTFSTSDTAFKIFNKDVFKKTFGIGATVGAVEGAAAGIGQTTARGQSPLEEVNLFGKFNVPFLAIPVATGALTAGFSLGGVQSLEPSIRYAAKPAVRSAAKSTQKKLLFGGYLGDPGEYLADISIGQEQKIISRTKPVRVATIEGVPGGDTFRLGVGKTLRGRTVSVTQSPTRSRTSTTSITNSISNSISSVSQSISRTGTPTQTTFPSFTFTPSPSASPTPSYSITPSINIQESITPSITETPSTTFTPSITPTQSFTPNSFIPSFSLPKLGAPDIGGGASRRGRPTRFTNELAAALSLIRPPGLNVMRRMAKAKPKKSAKRRKR